MNSSISSSRDVRLDLLRLVAFFLLIACHTCDPFNAAATYGSGEADAEFTRWGAIWGAVVRPCVPVFVMLTGALLLGRSRASLLLGHPVPMRSFYSRRIPRVLWPFLIWSCGYYLFPWVLGLLGFGADAVTLFFPWAETTDQSFATALGRIVRIPCNFSYVACHMWYIYMLLGLYLYLPIFDAWVSQATRRQKSFVLVLWGLSTFILPTSRSLSVPTVSARATGTSTAFSTILPVSTAIFFLAIIFAATSVCPSVGHFSWPSRCMPPVMS